MKSAYVKRIGIAVKEVLYTVVINMTYYRLPGICLVDGLYTYRICKNTAGVSIYIWVNKPHRESSEFCVGIALLQFLC